MEIKNKYTRKIDREYQRIMFENSDMGTDANGNAKTSIDMNQLQLAKDYLIIALCEITQDELDNMSKAEFEVISKKIDESIKPDEEKKKS